MFTKDPGHARRVGVHRQIVGIGNDLGPEAFGGTGAEERRRTVRDR
jgi:hypothetical protein